MFSTSVMFTVDNKDSPYFSIRNTEESDGGLSLYQNILRIGHGFIDHTMLQKCLIWQLV